MKKIQYSIKMSDYFKINKPEYVYLKLIPNTGVKNNKASDLVSIINKTYIEIDKRFKKYNKGFSYDYPSKVSFIIDINKDNACFYMIVPKLHVNEFNQKLTEIFGKITIEITDNIPNIKKDCTKYSLSYAKDDSLSLTVDKRDNDLLSANLSVMDILENDDRVMILYNFLPQSKTKLAAWKNYHVSMMKEYQSGKCLDKTFTLTKVFTIISNLLFMSIDTFTNSIKWVFGEDEKEDNTLSRLIPVQELSKTTKKKENAEIISTQIMILSQSNDRSREQENAKTLINTFSVVGGDADNKLIANKIIYKNNTRQISIKRKDKINIVKNDNKFDSKEDNIDFEKYNYDECEQLKMSDLEVGSNLIALAGKTLIEEYGLEAVQHNETIIPDELQGGNVIYGTNTFRGKSTTVTTSKNEDANCMPVVVMAKMGGGKTSLFENQGVDAIKNNESLISIDFIKNCEMSDNIIKNIDKDKVVVVNFADYMCLEGFGFNEIDMIRDMKNPMSRYECASLQSAQITQFIDSLGEEEFSASMGRFLDAACSAVLIHENKSIKDVVKCLECFKTREIYMNELKEFKLEMPEMYQELIDEELTALEELNEYKDEVVNKKKTGNAVLAGTSSSKISGIISRISQLKKNPSLKFMYARSPKNNINLVELMQECKAIFFKMPQSRFSSATSKNILVSYLFSKIEVAGIIRAEVYGENNLRTVNVICDEIQQAKNSFTNISEICYQLRKFRTKLILSTHGWQKIAPIRDILINSGATIMMLRGSSPKDFDVMKEEFERFGFTKDDLISLSHTDEYKALCLIATKKGRHGCLVILPKPVKGKIELKNVIEVDFNNRNDLENTKKLDNKLIK